MVCWLYGCLVLVMLMAIMLVLMAVTFAIGCVVIDGLWLLLVLVCD